MLNLAQVYADDHKTLLPQLICHFASIRSLPVATERMHTVGDRVA